MAQVKNSSSADAAPAPGDVRPVLRVISGQPTSDGAGVKLNRLIGTQALPDLDPFLMLDEFRSDDPSAYIAGFPNHPHRGFETVTYMLAGRLRHRDNKGNSGLLEAGSVQWMTAGRGIVHSEMPEQENGLMSGFQLWINLPARDKMTAPVYQDIPATRLPIVAAPNGVSVKVIAGSYGDVGGPVAPRPTEPLFLDISIPAGARFATGLDADHAAFTYVFEGSAEVGPEGAARKLGRGQLGVLGSGTGFLARTDAEPARLLLLAGRPLREPVAKYGPFVMNSTAELQQAFADYEAGLF
ncbi:MAG: quercetin 2,3-dioxygenase [Rhodospirillaceae bacterium]|nr:quercetin 2,3-dioxygenase [Rhodospirillaceae bacterium]